MKNRSKKIKGLLLLLHLLRLLPAYLKLSSKQRGRCHPALEVEFVYAEALSLPWRLRIASDVMVSVWCHMKCHMKCHVKCHTLSHYLVKSYDKVSLVFPPPGLEDQ